MIIAGSLKHDQEKRSTEASDFTSDIKGKVAQHLNRRNVTELVHDRDLGTNTVF